MIETVLTYIEKDGCYLMLYRNKKEHDLNEGKWLGIGGHVEKGETIDQAMIRETKEETGLDVVSYQYRGLVHFESDGYKEEMYVYTVDKYSGEIIECNEGTLQFFPKNEVFDLPSWEGDKYFLDLILHTDEIFEMTLRYKDDKLVEYKRIK